MKRLTLVFCAGWLMFAGLAEAAAPGVQLRSVKGEFTDVRDRVVMALESRGLLVNYTAKVGDMLDRTGRDRRIYNNAEVLEFCSAVLSCDTMEADPARSGWNTGRAVRQRRRRNRRRRPIAAACRMTSC
jgi:hypothetical protein